MEVINMDINFNYRIIQLANNKGTSLVDIDDFEDLLKYKWQSTPKGYVARGASISEKQNGSPPIIYMHRQIMGLIYNNRQVHVDHIYGNKSDNRRSKLRKCTNAENLRNMTHRVDSKSKVKGVSWHKKANKWQVHIRHNNKTIYLGIYSDINDAKNARAEGEINLGWLPITNI